MISVLQKKSESFIRTGLVNLIILLTVSSCAHQRPSPTPGYPPSYKVLGEWYQPLPSAKGYQQKGMASWYGPDFHGKKTANGETYNMHAMTAAHKTLPLGTWVRVRNLSNGKEVDVRINDRGPFVKNRIIDLSYTAAKNLGLVKHGTGRVQVTALTEPVSTTPEVASSPKNPGSYTLQVGSFGTKSNAENMVRVLSQNHRSVILVAEQGLFKVRVGTFTTREDAEQTKAQLAEQGYPAFTVSLN